MHPYPPSYGQKGAQRYKKLSIYAKHIVRPYLGVVFGSVTKLYKKTELYSS